MEHDAASVYWAYPAEVYQAEGMLSARLGVSIDQAARALQARASAQGVSMIEAALAVIAVRVDRNQRHGPPDTC
jgi:hypothetical protein